MGAYQERRARLFRRRLQMHELRKPEQMLLLDGVLLTVRGKDEEEERR